MINNGIAPENFNKNSRLNVTETNDDFGNYEGQNDSLLTLIHPELDMLSKNWQAALKDHALLLLPCGTYIFVLNTTTALTSFYLIGFHVICSLDVIYRNFDCINNCCIVFTYIFGLLTIPINIFFLSLYLNKN